MKKYQQMKLSDKKCKNARYSPDGSGNKLSDGGGLVLHLQESGKYWRLSYRFLGKQKTLALGVYPRVSLAEAREKRDNAKKLLAAGKDPTSEKRVAKIELHISHANNFEAVAREWHSQKLHTWKPEHAENILKRLEANIFNKIGARPIKEIRPSEVLDAVRVLEARGNRDLAHRMLQHCGHIFRYAVATGRAEHDITSSLKGALQPVKSKGLAYLNEKQLPDFIRKLENYDTVYRGNLLTKLAFKLMILTFLRSGEIRGAKWEEIDWEKAQWRIPEERMKMKSPHIVPLARQSLEILRQLQHITGSNICGYIFPNFGNPRKIMSENTLLKAIEILGYKKKTTAHGFRSTASTILNEHQFRPDAIERQLAHCERNTVRKAYNHAEYIVERAEMMQWYADYLDSVLIKRDKRSG